MKPVVSSSSSSVNVQLARVTEYLLAFSAELLKCEVLCCFIFTEFYLVQDKIVMYIVHFVPVSNPAGKEIYSVTQCTKIEYFQFSYIFLCQLLGSSYI